MNLSERHIVLIGFKHVGKSVIGKALANRLHKPFIDLDQEIEAFFKKKHQQSFTCRQIVQYYSEDFFRTLETQALQEIIQQPPGIVSVGGGTPLSKSNQKLLQSQLLVHILASKERVFERIMSQGIPAFFPLNQDPFASFNDLWEKREPIYRQLATVTVENNDSIDQTVTQIIQQLNRHNPI